MTAGGQHSRSPSLASNTGFREDFGHLGDACRDLAAAPADGTGAVERVLERTLEATGAERAFVVGSPDRRGNAPRPILATVSRRRDGERMPSRTVVDRSVAGGHVVICDDATRDPRFASGASVRALALRFVVSAPVALPRGERGALILDSRLGARSVRGGIRERLLAFAGLVGLVLRREGEDGRWRDRPRVGPEQVGESPAFRHLLARAKRVAGWPLPVLVTGESGSGKEGIARLLHRSSPRRRGPFVALNCAAVPETLLESELFGAVRGAYTGLERDRPGLFRRAHRGTLLLDEVGDMSPGMQARLLRVLQEERVRPVGDDAEVPVDVRVIAATHRDLRAPDEGRSFREDLYFRLAVIELHTPALRERAGDIPLLTRHLAAKLARKLGLGIPEWTPQATARLEAHDWPGNVRELETVVARAILNAEGAPIRARHIDIPRPRPPAGTGTTLETKMIEAALRSSGGVLSHAAAAIGWSRQKLTRRMTALGIGHRVPGSTRETTSSHSSTPQADPSRKAPHSS
jgi:hypothetical protein